MAMHAILDERKKYAKPSTSKSIPYIVVEIEDNSFESNVDKWLKTRELVIGVRFKIV